MRIERSWIPLFARGVLALVVGGVALFLPAVTASALVLAFGIFVIADGAFLLASAVASHADGTYRALLVIQGVIGLSLGALALISPVGTMLALVVWIAVWAILSGIFEIVAAIRLRRVLVDEWLLGLSGLASLVAGGLMLAFPEPSLVVLLTILGFYAVFAGASQIGLALRLRAMLHDGRFRTLGTSF